MLITIFLCIKFREKKIDMNIFNHNNSYALKKVKIMFKKYLKNRKQDSNKFDKSNVKKSTSFFPILHVLSSAMASFLHGGQQATEDISKPEVILS
jgi:hypothetical protein